MSTTFCKSVNNNNLFKGNNMSFFKKNDAGNLLAECRSIFKQLAEGKDVEPSDIQSVIQKLENASIGNANKMQAIYLHQFKAAAEQLTQRASACL